MRAKEFALLGQCVETGVRMGWQRAHKHTDTPEVATILSAVEDAVMNEVCEWFDFPQPSDEK